MERGKAMTNKDLRKTLTEVERIRNRIGRHTDEDLEKENIFERLWDLELRLREITKARKDPE